MNNSLNETTLLLEYTREGFIILDTDLRIISFNRSFASQYQQILGKEVEKGRSIMEYVLPDRREKVEALYRHVLDGNSAETEVDIPLPEGGVFVVKSHFQPILKDSRVVGVFVNSSDVSAIRKAERTLKESEQRYRALVENGGDAVVILNTEGKPTYVSASIRSVLGFTEEEAMDLDLFSLLHPEDWQPVRERMKEALEKPGIPVPGHTSRMRHKDGSWRWVAATITNMLHDESIHGIIDNFRDVTGEILAKKEKEKILGSISDGFCALDENWVFTYFNAEAARLVNRTREEVINQVLWEAFPGFDKSDAFERYQLVVKEQRSESFEFYYDDLQTWFEINAYPAQKGITIYFKDISERKKYQLQLALLNRDLRKRAEELSISNLELEQFAYVASHDLQEPLRMVSSFLTQLEKKYKDQLDERAQEYIRFAVDGARRMRAIILDLLEYSRVGRMEYRDEEVDMNTLLDEVLVLNSKLIESSGAIISRDHFPKIRATNTSLQQVMQNG